MPPGVTLTMWGWDVYARSTTIHAVRSTMDTGIAHVRDEVLPALKPLDGFIGLSMMVDRETGRSIATSAWRDEDSMRASADAVRALRARAAEILEGKPEVDEWEIAIMHREHPAHDEACVRSTWLQADPMNMDAMLDTYKLMALPQMELMKGFCSASLMVNRISGRTVSSACFETKADMEASRDTANQIRTIAAQQSGATVLEVCEFELALAHLRVPEMV